MLLTLLILAIRVRVDCLSVGLGIAPVISVCTWSQLAGRLGS